MADRRTHEYDIQIGLDDWIPFGYVGLNKAEATQIDHILVPLFPFLELLETECVAECCGICAYSFLPDTIDKALASYSTQEIAALTINLSTVSIELESMLSEIVVSRRINQYFRKEVFLALLAHILKVVNRYNLNVQA